MSSAQREQTLHSLLLTRKSSQNSQYTTRKSFCFIKLNYKYKASYKVIPFLSKELKFSVPNVVLKAEPLQITLYNYMLEGYNFYKRPIKIEAVYLLRSIFSYFTTFST